MNTPRAPVVALGADEIITVLVTEPPDPTSGQFAHFGRAVERTVDTFLDNSYNVDRKLLLERNRLAQAQSANAPYRAVTLYEAVRPERDATFNAGSYLYFEAKVLDSMYESGVRAATKWLVVGAGGRPPRRAAVAARNAQRPTPRLRIGPSESAGASDGR